MSKPFTQEFSQTAVSEEQRNFKMIKDWYKFYKQHKYVPVHKIDGVNSSDESTRAYRLSFNQIRNLTNNKYTADQKLGIRIYGNCYSKTLKKFFGRSMESKLLHLYYTDQQTWEFREPNELAVYYHTRVDKTADCYLTFEIYLYLLEDQDVVKHTESLGYGMVLMTQNNQQSLEKQEPLSMNLRKGSPRELISTDLAGKNADKCIVEFYQTYSPYFEQVKYLVPESCLIGSNELLPGLQNPFTLPNNDVETPADDKGSIQISNIQIFLPQSIIQELQKQIQSQQQSISQGIQFKERRFSAGFHNGWTLINSKGLENSVILQEDAEKEDENGNKIIVLKPNINMQVDRFFHNEFGLLVFQLEYVYMINKGGGAYIEETRVLGYLPKPILSFAGNSNYEVRLESFISGKGKTVDHKRICDLGRDEIQLSLNINANAAGVPFDAMSNQGRPQNFRQNRQSRDSSADKMDRSIIEERERLEQERQEIEFQKRKMEKERERYMQDRSPSANRDDRQFNDTYQSRGGGTSIDEKQIKQIYSKIDEQEIKIEEEFRYLRKENKKLLTTTQDQFQTIEKFMNTMKSSQQKFFENQNRQTYEGGNSRGNSRGRRQNDDDSEEEGYYNQNQQQQRRNPRQDYDNSYINVQKNYKKEDDRAYKSNVQYDGKEISRGDIGYLTSQGVQGLLDDQGDPNRYDDSYQDILKKERADKLKSNLIKIKFLAIKPLLQEIMMQNSQSSQFQEEFCLPERVRFSLYFYDYPKFDSDSITYSDAGNTRALNKKLQQGELIVLMREAFLRNLDDKKDAAYSFEVDPSAYKYKQAHKQFINYLYFKSMHIDIWDADTQMLYGTVKVPLKTFLRQGNPEQYSNQEFSIIDPSFQRIRGYLQIQLGNIGKEQKVRNYEDQEVSNNISGKDRVNGLGKKKVKSQKPQEVPKDFFYQKETKNNRDELNNNQEERKRQRIAKFKHQQLQEAITLQKDNISSDINKRAEAKKKLLEEINIYKQQKKDKFVKDVLSEFLSDEIIHPCFFGKQDIVKYTYTNTTGQKSTFQIQIQDPDKNFLQDYGQEVQLIQNQNEWAFWAKQEGEKEPAYGFDCITYNTVTLDPQESITLLFKVLSYRQLDHQMANMEHVEDIIEDKEEAYRKKYINQRTVKVYITNKAKNQDAGGFKLRIIPYQQILDHLFRYYERENKALNLVLPSLYHKVEAQKTIPYIVCTNTKAILQQPTERNRDIIVQLNAPPAGEIKRFNVLAYQDAYKSELLGNWMVEINSLKGIELNKIKLGRSIPFKLPVDSEIQRTVKLYSSHPNLISFRDGNSESRTLQPNRRETIEAIAKSNQQTDKKVQVNCVDVNTKELVHSWIVSIDTDAPTISKMYQIECIVNQDNFFAFKYFNKASSYQIYTFESSEPERLVVIESTVPIERESKKSIKIKFPAQENPGMSEIFVFASDENESNFEVMLFKVKYSNQ